MYRKPFLNNVNYKSDNVITLLSGGINNIYPNQFIADDETQELINFSLENYPALRTKVGRTMFKNPGIKGELIKYFGVAGLNYLFYIQNQTLKNELGDSIATDIVGEEFSHTYYKDGQSEYLILYGKGINPIRIKLPLSNQNTPEIIPVPEENEEKIYFEHMCYHKRKNVWK